MPLQSAYVKLFAKLPLRNKSVYKEEIFIFLSKFQERNWKKILRILHGVIKNKFMWFRFVFIVLCDSEMLWNLQKQYCLLLATLGSNFFFYIGCLKIFNTVNQKMLCIPVKICTQIFPFKSLILVCMVQLNVVIQNCY